MRWGHHLLTALLVGIILVLIYEIYTGVSLAEAFQEPISKLGAGMFLALLIFVALIAWVQASRG
jgi:hypothetical protein